ncbi:hypothetical protein LINPERPRIM_LOCUS1239 [Linum perenne]
MVVRRLEMKENIILKGSRCCHVGA